MSQTKTRRHDTIGEAMLEAFPDDRSILERLIRWEQRLLFHMVRDHAGQQFAMLDGWPSYVRRALGIIRRYYHLEEGWCEPSVQGPLRTCQTWKLRPKAKA